MFDTSASNALPRRPRLPKTGIPLADAVEIFHGPASLLGRFFLQADACVRQYDLTLEFARFEELAETQAHNRSNWSSFNPMFDSTLSDIPSDSAFCVVARRRSGEIVATCSAKTWDARVRSLKDIVERGDFFSLRPSNEVAIGVRITAPVAATMHGELLYNGGVWVHPDLRGSILARLMSKLGSAASIALWDPDIMLTFLTVAAVSPKILKSYGLAHAEPSLVVTKDGVTIYEGVMAWVARDDLALDLADFLSQLGPEINSAVTT